MMKNRKAIIGIVVLATLMVSTVAAAITILYSLNIPATWNVTTAQGLEIDNATTGLPITNIAFVVSPLGSTTESFMLRNTANHAVNVTDNMPSSTNLYQFTSTFLNSTTGNLNTISQGGNYNFTITLTDLGMDSNTQYSGNFAFNIASGFNGPSSDTFGSTNVNYSSDTAQYFSFVSDGFNASSYTLGSTVLYDFATKNVNQTYMIQALTYSLAVYDNGNNLVETVANGLTDAYWENSTAYGTFGNGTQLATNPLLPNQSMTIWNSFLVPSNGTGPYHMSLQYTSHNAAPYNPPPTPITWTLNTTSTNPSEVTFCIAGEPQPNFAWGLPSPSITNASVVGQEGTVQFSVVSMWAPTQFDYDYTIALYSGSTLLQTIASGSGETPAQKKRKVSEATS